VIETGYSQLDKALVGGFRKQELIVLGARSRIGKSAFILSLVANIAVNNDVPILIVSLEMKKEALAKRIFAIESGITKGKFEYPHQWNDTDFKTKAYALKKVSENYLSPVYITDKPKQTLLEIESTAQRLFLEHKKPGIVFIDHLGLIYCSEKMEGGERAVIDYITRELKVMAKRLDCPVIVLSQLNRETDKTADKKPTLSNLRMSGMIEANADIVLLLHRDDCYRKPGETKTNKAELTIAKGREGGSGYITFDFIDYLTKFIEKEGEF
jgi:replicative DNA helicase